MPERPDKRPAQPTLAPLETDLFGAILDFHQKTMTLLRQSSLKDEVLNIVGERIKTLLDDATAAVTQTHQMNLTERLEAAYDEIKRLVAELSGSPGGDKENERSG